jgi:hypothetical protein
MVSVSVTRPPAAQEEAGPSGTPNILRWRCPPMQGWPRGRSSARPGPRSRTTTGPHGSGPTREWAAAACVGGGAERWGRPAAQACAVTWHPASPKPQVDAPCAQIRHPPPAALSAGQTSPPSRCCRSSHSLAQCHWRCEQLLLALAPPARLLHDGRTPRLLPTSQRAAAPLTPGRPLLVRSGCHRSAARGVDTGGVRLLTQPLEAAWHGPVQRGGWDEWRGGAPAAEQRRSARVSVMRSGVTRPHRRHPHARAGSVSP